MNLNATHTKRVRRFERSNVRLNMEHEGVRLSTKDVRTFEGSNVRLHTEHRGVRTFERSTVRGGLGRGQARGGERGVSAVELMVASLMLVMVVVPVFAMLGDGQRLFARGDAAANLHADMRGVLDRIVRELRMAGYDPSASGAGAAFEANGATIVRFIADVDGDGVTDRVEYAYDAAARTVTRQVWSWAGAAWSGGSGAMVVARNVDSVAFAYFDAIDGPPPGLADIRRVTVSLAGSQMVGSQGLERYSVASEARARNLL